jgi:hypothetical protein
MSRLKGYQTCPRCQIRSLPRIQPDSQANAVKCQNPKCRAVIKRPWLEALAEQARLKAIEDAKKKAMEDSK